MRATYAIETTAKAPVKIKIRVPEYAQNYKILCDGKEVEYKEEKGFAAVEVSKNVKLEVVFEADAKFVRANPQVREDAGKVAITRGPLVYCLEEADNGANLSAITVDTEKELRSEVDETRNGYVVVKAHGKRLCEEQWKDGLYSSQKLQKKDVELLAVPYFYWNNRGMGELEVWIRED